MPDSAHKAVVREAFTRQAEVYAVMPTVADPARIALLIEAIAPAPESRVLEVACGPGFLTLAFAQRCGEAVGLDLTDAPLAIAEKRRQELGLANIRFQRGDAERLPFPDGDFDVAVCRLALHHIEEPGRVAVGAHSTLQVCSIVFLGKFIGGSMVTLKTGRTDLKTGDRHPELTHAVFVEYDADGRECWTSDFDDPTPYRLAKASEQRRQEHTLSENHTSGIA